MACRPVLAAAALAALLAAGCGGVQHAAKRIAPQHPQITIDGPRLSATLAREGDLAGIPGAAAAIAVDGRLAWSSGWGTADIERDRPMRATTPVALMSISKTLTTAVALRMVDEERVTLDEPVARWIPEWRPGAGLTLRDLLSQRSGLADPPPSLERKVFADHRNAWRPEAWLPAIARPGRRGADAYANSNFILAGLILQRAAGKDWPALVRAVAPQLSLQAVAPVSTAPARGYWYPDSSLRPRPVGVGGRYVPSRAFATFAWTAGGWAGSVEDLVTWADALFAGRIVSRQSLRAMTAFRPGTIMWEGYGLGLARQQIDEYEVWGHSGDGPGFHSELWHLPRERLTLAIVWNDEGLDDVAIPRKLLRTVMHG